MSWPYREHWELREVARLNLAEPTSVRAPELPEEDGVRRVMEDRLELFRSDGRSSPDVQK